MPDVAYILSFYPNGVEIELIFALRAAVSKVRQIFKIAIFGHETWPLAKVPEFAHMLPSYHRGSKLGIFLLYEKQFLSCRPIFKIAIIAHETWQVAKVPEFANIPSFYPRVVEIESIFALWAAVSKI